MTAGHRASVERQQYLRGLFDHAAPSYERVIRWGSLGTGQWYRRQALARAGLRPGMRVLDLATGTGATARAAVDLLGSPRGVTGVDASLGMLREARARLPARFVQGEAERLPLRAAAFDFLVLAYALRHVASLETAFRECFRVLAPGGTAVILEFHRPRRRWSRGVMRWYIRSFVPWLARSSARGTDAGEMLRYCWDTVDGMAPADQVVAALARSGFPSVRCRVWAGVFSEYVAVRS